MILASAGGHGVNVVAVGAVAASVISAAAAWTAVLVDATSRRRAWRPRLALQALSPNPLTGVTESLLVVSNEPQAGVAYAPLLCLHNAGNEWEDSVGKGFLHGGERIELKVPWPIQGHIVQAVICCRDRDDRLHVWTARGDHGVYRVGRWPRRYRKWPEISELFGERYR